METFKTIEGRASVREYRDKPIPKSKLEKLVDAGRRAPTARHVEPWEFVIIEDRQTLERLSDVAPNGVFVKRAVACIAIFCKETKYYLEDGCAATENILLAAADLGLGACWIAGDKKDYAGEVSKMLGASAELKLVSMISLGYPAGKVEQKKYRALKEVIHWEGFQ